MPSALRRRAGAGLSALAIAAALGAAGCGGGGDDSSKKDYQASLNQFCRTVEQGSKRVQTDATAVQGSATKDPKAAIKKLGGVLDTFASTIDAGLGKLKQADVPSDYEKFNTSAVKGIGQLVDKLHQAAGAAEKGDIEAITSLGSALDGVKLPDLPSELSKHAPACTRISG